MISATVIGNVGQDPELRPAGTDKVLSFSLASNDGKGDQKVTTWVRCTVWGKRGETLAGYIKKGKKLACSGSLMQREYTNAQGEKRTELSLRVDQVEFCDKLADTAQASGGDASFDPNTFAS